MKLANVIAVIGLTALLAVTGLVLLEVLLRTGPVLALRDQFHHVDEALRHWGMDGLSDLYAPLGIVACDLMRYCWLLACIASTSSSPQPRRPYH